ncbi:hypothetical protein C0995_015234 [Termitomyces sp. Mi166|nr:hypothetical protein C0995_015234 [Termitomyces sp. Mi166\
MSLSIPKINAPFLAAWMTDLALLGITCSQTAYYFRMYPGDHQFLKGVVAVLFIMEGAHVAFLAQGVHYDYILSKIPENTLAAFNFSLGSPVGITMTVILTSAVQIFYAWRIYRLSARYQWQKLLFAFILATSLGQFCTGLIVNAAQFVYGNAPLEVMDTPDADLVLFTSTIAMLTLLTYYLAPSESSVYTYFVMINGKFYFNSMLVTYVNLAFLHNDFSFQ